ncbi:MAG: hypothetical protein M1830_008638 [Pleopsidium flavum]|nr:MAG: hypothetical protein M1830_008638 [Pleopsidium flavum]
MASIKVAMRGLGGGKGKEDNNGDDRNDEGQWWCRKCQSWKGHDTNDCARAGPAGPRLSDIDNTEIQTQMERDRIEAAAANASKQFQSSAPSKTKETQLLTSATWHDAERESPETELVKPAVQAPIVTNLIQGSGVDSREQNSHALAKFQAEYPGSQSFIHCRRPGFGTGESIWVLANCFAVDLPKGKLYTYSLQGIPQSATSEKKQRLVRQVIAGWHLLYSQSEHWATDHASIIVASRDLSSVAGGTPLRPGESLDAPAIHYFNPGSSTPSRLVVKLQYTGTLDPTQYSSFVEGRAPEANVAELSQAFNLIMAKHANTPNAKDQKEVLQVGKNKFFYKAGWSSLSAGLVAYRGYLSSIRPGMSRVLLNVNKVTSAFFEPQYLHDFIKSWFNIGSQNKRTLYVDEISELEKVLWKVKVRIMYDRSDQSEADINRESRREKTVMGVGWPLRTQTFSRDGRDTLVRDYLKSTWHLDFQHDQLPCINVGGKEPGKEIWIPAEKLRILPHQLFRSKLKDAQTEQMVKLACRTPQENASAIAIEGLRLLGITPRSEVLQTFGISVANTFLKLPARCLRSPEISYRYNQEPCYRGKGTWNLRDVQFHDPKPLPALCVLNLREDGGRAYNARPVAEVFVQILERYGLNTGPPIFDSLVLPSKIVAIYVGHLRERLRQAFKRMHISNIALVLLPTPDSWLYTTIKHIADCEFGLATVCTQVVKVESFGQMHIRNGALCGFLANLAMKVNIKLGGTNHTLQPGLFGPKLIDNGTPHAIIIGADVTHPDSHSTEGTPSIAAVVGSIDSTFGRYPGSMRLQTSKQEFISELRVMVFERLQAWVKAGNVKLPRSILFYRDGVSEGQYGSTRLKEIPQVMGACVDAEHFLGPKHNPFGENRYQPAITYIVVSKRHHTRFYPATTRKDERDRTGNTLPGTVVDSEITSPYDFDFYLQAHAPMKGQARPAHYYVLRDDNKFSANDLQQLTMNLSYTYARSTGGVSYAPPAYYADRLCTRGRDYLKELFEGARKGKVTVQSVLAERGLWSNHPNASGRNPWHKNLDDVMFYL